MTVAWENKINLTAALRMAARLDLHEGVDNPLQFNDFR